MKRNRVDAVLDRLEQMGLEQLVITDATSIFYLTGIWVDAGERLVALYLSRHRDCCFFVNNMFNLPPDPGVKIVRFSDTDPYLEMLAGCTDKMCIRDRPITGVGLRTTMTLEDNYDKVLDNFLRIDFKQMGVLQNNPYWKDFSVSTGLLLVFAVGCLLMWLFMKTKAGIIMRCSGVNPGFSRTLGVNNNRVRTIGIVASTVIAAIGINIYSQSYGFYQFYSAPLMMAFPAMAAILIGGATPKKASVFNVVLGVIPVSYTHLYRSSHLRQGFFPS